MEGLQFPQLRGSFFLGGGARIKIVVLDVYKENNKAKRQDKILSTKPQTTWLEVKFVGRLPPMRGEGLICTVLPKKLSPIDPKGLKALNPKSKKLYKIETQVF